MRPSASYAYEPAERLDVDSRFSSPMHSLLTFDRASIRALDRAAIEQYGIPAIVLMENAARGLTERAMRFIDEHSDRSGRVIIVCGSGNNGGDGYAMARHLHNHGIDVAVTSLGDPKPNSEAAINRRVAQAMNIAEITTDQLCDASLLADTALIVDAIYGTGLDRTVTGLAADVIDCINEHQPLVLAVDLPSGMDCDTGAALGTAIRADITVTLVGWKKGFLELNAQKLLGEVVVTDIGAPTELLEQFGRHVEIPHPEAPEHVLTRRRHRRPGR